MDLGPGPTDRELVRRAQGGEPRAFDELVLRHQDRVYNIVFRFCGRAEDAADICQRAFINAWRKIGEFAGDSAFSTWIYRIAFNQSVSFRRESGRLRPAALEDRDGRMAAEPAVESPAGEHLEGQDHQRKVQEALAALAEDERRIIILKDIEDRPYEEIAEILEVPKGTVRSRLHRARMALKEKLKPYVREITGTGAASPAS